ncbi:MAG: cellulose synthase/poly-beta-1,6-N-acetylglucosamine synthase-like glycosyltransferase [Bradymonadia bacterium]|jgi:cellulose synthase/poly-beta-1,6-N-acetylglucosamine synthase-like glycosyltransferase
MSLLSTIFLAVYFVVLALLAFYGAHRYHMAWLYFRHKKDAPVLPPQPSDAEIPYVTIQLPVFNERYVVERLIDTVCAIRYPRDKLEIQVLDDSTDDTVDISRAAIARWAAQGVDITLLTRTDRTGYKAGALQAGMKVAKGDFIAIFDADFIPTADFLESTVPYFAHAKTGMVQARWDHINRRYSMLTQAQSILLDGHFIIEHTARNRSGRFFNFNGTAGIWRKSCIEDAGGWQHETLTEDLDLSYRAQLKGWEFIFLKDLLQPAEIPVEMNAFKAQQHRWAKGSIQVARKILPTILRSEAPGKVKREAFIHLTNNVAYVLMVIMSIMLPFALQIRIDHGWYETMLIDLPFFMGATVSVCSFYLLCQIESGERPWYKSLLYLPVVLALGIGLAVNNTKATLEALVGHESPFVRTPKLAAGTDNVLRPRRRKYRGSKTILPWIELAFGLVYTYTVIMCIQQGIWLALPFMIIFQCGFLYTSLMSLLQWSTLLRRRPAKTEASSST